MPKLNLKSSTASVPSTVKPASAPKPARNVKAGKPTPTASVPVNVLGVQAAAQASAGRSNVVAPSAPTVKPATTDTTNEPRKPSGNITRTAATVARNVTAFNELSDRDSAYLAFYASLAKAAPSGVVTLADIVASGRRPTYNGSNKPHDAGVINRLRKASFIAPVSDGTSFTITDNGKSRAEYTTAR